MRDDQSNYTTFSKNGALNGGTLSLIGNYNHSIITLNKVILDLNNHREYWPVALIGDFCTLKILQSRILSNGAPVYSGVLIENVKFLEVVDSIFEGNYYPIETAGSHGGRAAIEFSAVNSDFTSNYSVLIVNTTFNSCSSQYGGAIFFNIDTDKRVRVRIKNSRFTKNFAYKGGAIWFSLAPDTQEDLECITQDKILKVENIDAIEEEPSWDYKSHVLIEDTKFDENAAEVGGAVYITNGNVTFSNCHFVNNLASSFGSHIYTVES